MRKKIKCPHCGKEAFWEGNPFRPFCCEECKLADLHKWLSEEYLVCEEIESGGEVVKEDNAGP
ncbi:DNA gyrase inhibitor YacG [Thermovibrio sp.]